MSLATWWRGKVHAVRTLTRMARYLRNWREVWRAYRGGSPIPALQFRRGFTLRHGPGDDAILLLHEVFGERAYARVGRPAPGIVIDGGANIGAAALDWASRGSEVHAYEPAPVSRERLAANVAASPFASRIRVFPEALAERSGTIRLFVSEHSVLSSTYPLPAQISPGVEHEVPSLSLKDAVVRAGGAVRVLKLDVEGAEGDILAGADGATLRAVERVVLEYHDHLVPGVRRRCEAALTAAGFVCRARPASPTQGLLYARRAG